MAQKRVFHLAVVSLSMLFGGTDMQYFSSSRILRLVKLSIFLFVINIFTCQSIVYARTNYIAYNDLLLMDKIDIKQLYDINIDFIKHGFAEYYKTGDRDYITRSLHNKGYKLYTKTPGIDEHWKTEDGQPVHCLVRITSRSRNVFSDIFCIYQKEYEQSIYEYWMIKQWVVGRSYPYKKCSFIITKALSRKDERNIIHQSKEFFKEYKVDDKFSVVFPEDEIYKISAHGFDSCPK